MARELAKIEKVYEKLDRHANYDKAAVEQYAEALTEVYELKRRAEYLKDIINDNRAQLADFVWTTAEGKTIALHDISDEHLTNIMNHLREHGKSISKTISAEAKLRNIAIPKKTVQDVAEDTNTVYDLVQESYRRMYGGF